MASGFQQNENQLTPGLYRVVVDLTGYSTTAANEDAGGVETRDNSAFGTQVTTTANGQRRARGNLRWQGIVENLGRGGDFRILDIEELETTGPSVLDNADDTTGHPPGPSYTSAVIPNGFVLTTQAPGTLPLLLFTRVYNATHTDIAAFASQQGIAWAGAQGYTPTGTAGYVFEGM